MPARALEGVEIHLKILLLHRQNGAWVAIAEQVDKPAAVWPTDNKEFGAAVLRARQAKRVQQKELADLAGISSQHLRQLETGRKNISPRIRELLLEALQKLGLEPVT